MNAEIIAVGTEILLGQISNTNAAYLSEQLAALGINVYWQTVVGDNRQRLSQAVQTAEGRSDLVITIGGLGPTDDDLTKEVVADYLKVDLVPNEMAAEKIAAYQKRTGKMLTTNNAKQALMLKGARPLANLNGYAWGTFMLILTGLILCYCLGHRGNLKRWWIQPDSHFARTIS